MNHRTVSLLLIILVGVIGISLVGFAGGQTVAAPAKPIPQLLGEAGFKVFSGDKVEAYMQHCPKDTMMIHTKGGTTVYCYVDQASNTMYHGDEAAYQRFHTLLKNTQQTIKEKKIENDPEFWHMWQSIHGIGG